MLLRNFSGKNPSKELPEIYKLLHEFINVEKVVDSTEKRVFSKKLVILVA